MENEINQVHKIKSLVLGWEAEWTIFVLNGSGLEDLSSTPPLKLLLSAPPPGGGLCRLLTCVGLTVVKIAPGKVIGDSNGDKFFSVWYCSKTNWNPVEWWVFFYKKKPEILHFHNITSCKGYMSKNCHENYGKSKLMQKCLKYMYKLSKKMHVFAHTTNTSCKVCIFSPKYQAS